MTTLTSKSCGGLVVYALPGCCFAGAFSLSLPLQHELFLKLTSIRQGVSLDHRVIAFTNVFYS
jgi:hypothetical protein